MKDHVSLQERLKDLRVEKGLKLEELAEKTGISKSALASYENEENRNKEINHGNLHWQTFMRYPLTICSAGQKTGNRSTPRCLNCI